MTDVIDPVEVSELCLAQAEYIDIARKGDKALEPVAAALRQAAAALAKHAAAEAAGMVWVPVAPTHAMEVAAFHVFEIDNPKQYINGTAARNAVYAAMIAAARPSLTGPDPNQARDGED
jgi:hypothetical protein